MSLNVTSYALHLYAYPTKAQPGTGIRIREYELNSLHCPDAAIATTCFQCTFEQAVDRLQHLERMFVELDGSFLWTGHDAHGRWQIDGMLYDDGQRLKRVELRGCCPRPAWQQLLGCFDWPDQRLLAHWIEWHCFLEVDQLLQTDLFLPRRCDPT